LQQSAAASGSAFTIVESFQPTSIAEVAGQTTTLIGQMFPVSPNETVRLKVDGARFAALNAQLLPNATSEASLFRVLAQPYAAPATAAASWATGVAWPTLVNYVPGSAITYNRDDGDLPYGNPYPGTEYAPLLLYQYRLQGEAIAYPPPSGTAAPGGVNTTTYACTGFAQDGFFGGWAFTHPPMNAGAAARTSFANDIYADNCFWQDSPATLLGEIGVYLPPPASGTPPVRPVIGPVGTITVDGQPFTGGTMNISRTPTIAWSAPTLGSADQSVVTLSPLSSFVQPIRIGNYVLGNNTNNNISCCQAFVTTATSITLPPVLESNTYYLLAVEADSFGGGNANPATLPVGYAFTTAGVIVTGAN
jgi:hypothetical protein